jgi:hypothetical protein
MDLGQNKIINTSFPKAKIYLLAYVKNCISNSPVRNCSFKENYEVSIYE